MPFCVPFWACSTYTPVPAPLPLLECPNMRRRVGASNGTEGISYWEGCTWAPSERPAEALHHKVRSAPQSPPLLTHHCLLYSPIPSLPCPSHQKPSHSRLRRGARVKGATMVVVACVLLLFSCSIASQARLTSSLAAGWQDGQVVRKTNKVWLYNDRNKTPPWLRSSGRRGTAQPEPEEMLVKRTSGSSSHRRLLLHLQSTSLRPEPPNHIHPGALPAPVSLGGGWPGLSTAAPSHGPAEGPSVPHTEPGSSSKQPNKAKRRPYGSLASNPALKKQANRERQASAMQRIKNGERVNKTKPDGTKYKVSTFDEYQFYNRDHSRRFRSNLPEEKRVGLNQQRSERKRRAREAKKAQLEGERPQQEQEKAGAEALTPSAILGASTQRTPPDVPGPATLPLRTPASSAGSSFRPVFSFPPAVPHHRFAPEPSSPSLKLGLSLSAPGSSSSGQRQTTDAPQQAAPPPARTLEEQRLQFTLAPPGQHDRLRLTLAQPRHN